MSPLSFAWYIVFYYLIYYGIATLAVIFFV